MFPLRISIFTIAVCIPMIAQATNSGTAAPVATAPAGTAAPVAMENKGTAVPQNKGTSTSHAVKASAVKTEKTAHANKATVAPEAHLNKGAPVPAGHLNTHNSQISPAKGSFVYVPDNSMFPPRTPIIGDPNADLHYPQPVEDGE